MWTVLWKALALASGGMISIGSILLVVMLLGTARGLPKAIAYFCGYSGGYLLIGTSMLLIGGQLSPSTNSGGTPWISGSLNLLIGCILLYFGQKKLRTPAEENPQPPKWFASLDKMSTIKALGVGLMVSVINFKNLAIYLSAVSVVLDSAVPLTQGLWFVLAIDAVFCSTVLLPIVVYAIFSTQALPWLTATRQWLEKNNRPFSLVVMFLFGTFFVAKGTLALIS